MTTVIIPMRKNSKGLKNKNVMDVNGKPLYKYTLDVAQKLDAEKIILNTDIEDLLVQKVPGVCTEFRPKKLAGDHVPIFDVISHTVKENNITGTVVLLQVTSPLRTVSDVKSALEIYKTNKYGIVLSVQPSVNTCLKSGIVKDGRYFAPESNTFLFSNRQDLPIVYKPNGAIYIFDARISHDIHSHMGNIGVYVMPKERSIDIDSTVDVAVFKKALIEDRYHEN